jgi:cytoskeletal protein RodZ
MQGTDTLDTLSKSTGQTDNFIWLVVLSVVGLAVFIWFILRVKRKKQQNKNVKPIIRTVTPDIKIDNTPKKKAPLTPQPSTTKKQTPEVKKIVKVEQEKKIEPKAEKKIEPKVVVPPPTPKVVVPPQPEQLPKPSKPKHIGYTPINAKTKLRY